MEHGFLETAKAKKTEDIALPPVASTPPSVGVLPKGDGSFSPRPHIKLPYGKVETGNVAAVIEFLQPNIVTAQPTEGVVSKKVFGRDFSGDTVDYGENMTVFTTLPPKKLDNNPDNWTLADLQRRILSTPGFPRPVQKTAGRKVNHRVGPSPFGGLGVFATRLVRTGDLILAETPLLVLPKRTAEPGSKGLTEEEMIQAMHEEEERLGIAVKRMTDVNREAFMALANCHTEDSSGPILGIVRTNAYKVPGLYDAHEGVITSSYIAVLNVMSRINHSCSPNTRLRFDMASLSFQLRAVRDIEKGEELFSSYCDFFQTKSERAEALTPYGIVCTCPGCVGATKETDLFRSELPKRFEKIQADHLIWMKDQSRPNVLAASLKLIAEIEEEGLSVAPQFSLLLEMVANVYSASGNMYSAMMRYLGQLDNHCRERGAL